MAGVTIRRGCLPPGPDPGPPHPEEAISPAKLGPGRRSLVHGELLAQGEVLQGELAVAVVKEREESKQVEQHADHWTAIVSGSEPKDSTTCPLDGVLAMDRMPAL